MSYSALILTPLLSLPLISRSLSFKDFPQCPPVPGMGACRFPTGFVKGSGVAMGYVTGDLVVEEEGVLRLSYYNGEKWCGNGHSSVVNVYFRCDKEQNGVSGPLSISSVQILINAYSCPCCLVYPRYL